MHVLGWSARRMGGFEGGAGLAALRHGRWEKDPTAPSLSSLGIGRGTKCFQREALSITSGRAGDAFSFQTLSTQCRRRVIRGPHG